MQYAICKKCLEMIIIIAATFKYYIIYIKL